MSFEISRRSALLGAAGFAAQSFSRPLLPDKKPVGWAVLGLGYYGVNRIMTNMVHCKNTKLVALISGHPEKLQKFGSQYNIPETHRYTYDQMDAIKDNPDIEVVYVITPPSTHLGFTERAALAGKHVCSEKPMAPTPEDCQKMIDVCRKHRRLLQIGYRCHYEAHNLRAIQACRSGELGRITELMSDHGFNIGHGQWRTQRALAGGGSMMDIGIYALNALRYLSGEEPVEVSATMTQPKGDDRFVDCEDEVDFKLTFPSGLVGHGRSGYSWSPGKNNYTVVGTKGKLFAEPATGYDGDHMNIDGTAVEVTENNQWAEQMDHFSDCIRMGKKVKTPGEEGLRDIRIIHAIYDSANSGKPVRLHH